MGANSKNGLHKKSWSNTELLKLHDIDDSDIFKSKLFKLVESNKLNTYSHIYIGQRNNLKKIDSPLKAKFERYNLKCVSEISKRSINNLDKYFLNQDQILKTA
ncbi:hypothetical protein [Halobacteriovorax marinus]|uniref:hypothetical protein n=1 Tax=Halobacteriovorax marinus TaxID=97084 RepID=UPI003A905422